MPSEEESQSLSGSALDLLESFPTMDLQMGYDFTREENLFEEFRNVFDNLLPGNDEVEAKMTFDSNLFDSLMQIDDTNTQWPVFPQLSDLNNDGFKSEFSIKRECETPVDSPRSVASSDSSNSSEPKYPVLLETPPVSPPRSGTVVSPPATSPTLLRTTEKKSTILKINPKNIKIIPCPPNIKGLKPIGKQTQVVLPKEILEKVEKIKKENEICPPVDVKVPNLQPKVVFSSPIAITPCEVKKVMPNVTVIPSDKVVTLEASNHHRPLTILQRDPVEIKREDINLKALKKQQRMIKNRESACLSRKKKKEYVMNLESKISDLEKENRSLKLENDILKSRIKELESPDCVNSYNKPGIVFNNFKKTTALLAVIFMVSINFGSLSLIHKENVMDEMKMNGGNLLRDGRTRHPGRSLLWADSDEKQEPFNLSSKPPMCPLYVNQTESLRLEKELRRWIAVDSERGMDKNTTKPNTLHKPTLRQLILHTPSFKPWKAQRMQRTVDGAIEIYRAAFPSSLPRRDDTFYVVSFSNDHLLLPAIAHNMSVRPKMSLVLPTIPLNDSIGPNGKIAMMQIDCEVLATRSIHFTGKEINALRQTRNQPKGNTTTHQGVKETPYRPYFVRPSKPNVNSEFDQNFDPYENRVYRSSSTFP